MVKVFASSSSWIEGSAIEQLQQTAALPGMREVAGMPDLHPGKGCAVGTVAISEGIIYPHLIGNDIGCGYSLFNTNISAEKVKPEKLADRITGIDYEWDGDIDAFLLKKNINWSARHAPAFGTLGGGNHFAELQRIDTVEPEIASEYGLDTSKLVLLVHSGSRSLGESIFQEFAALFTSKGFEENSENFEKYLLMHDNAVLWAAANREIIAHRLLECLGAEGELLLDLPHNFIQRHEDGYIHRKGAAPANRGLSPLPGSRGTYTYLLNPLKKDGIASLAHGAGRKSSRANMHGRIKQSIKEMTLTPLGGIVVCGSELLMREEHHSAYKSVEKVLADLKENELATDVAKLVPVLTYKSEREKPADRQPKREKERDWRDERRRMNRK